MDDCAQHLLLVWLWGATCLCSCLLFVSLFLFSVNFCRTLDRHCSYHLGNTSKFALFLQLFVSPDKSPSSQSPSTVQRVQISDSESLSSGRAFVREVLRDCLLKLQEESSKQTKSIRWELGACWVQHLQNQASGKTESKKHEETKPEPTVKGLGKQGALLKEIKKKLDVRSTKAEEGKDLSMTDMNKKLDGINQKELEKKEEEMETMWKQLVHEAAYIRLKQSETGLHLKSPSELIEMAHTYYADTALPKLVELADKLPHVQSLCIHEMIVRVMAPKTKETLFQIFNSN